MTTKQPFQINWVMEQIREAVRPFPQAAMFALARQGYTSLFEQLIACIISIRTYDEVSLPVSQRLFARARTPEAIAQLSLPELTHLIRDSTYAEPKAEQIQTIAQQILRQHQGELPADLQILRQFKGVGPKCAHLALGIACSQPYISVDTHVHRVTNRWGYVQTKTPEKTLIALEKTLPSRYWIEINQLLVPFGKHICTPTAPHCTTCPVITQCRQVGVSQHR